MGALVNRFLREISRQIEPSAKQKSEAKGSHLYVRKKLASGNFESAIIRPFLIGSYARHTAIYPIDDVDVMIQVDPDFWKIPLFSSLPEPKVVIESLHRVVKRRYPTSGVFSQRRSIGLQLSKRSIDIVPAVATRAENEYWIPDTREEEWIKTAPERHTWRIQEVNGLNDKRFVPLVKLLKHWNSLLPSSTKFKSFGIESMAAQLFADNYIESLEDGLMLFFDFVQHAANVSNDELVYQWNRNYDVSLGFFRAHAPDISGLGGNALGGVSWSRRRAFVNKARIARNHLIEISNRPTEANIRNRLAKIF